MPKSLLQGLTRFKKEFFPQYEEHFRKLVSQGQSPNVLFIGCSDSRIIPDRLTNSGPGDLFVVRNVGNLIPPYEIDSGFHGVTAAIEYAVDILNVQDIIVCGHSHCGAIRSLYQPPPRLSRHIEHWLQLAQPAKLDSEPTESLLRRTEQRSIVLQLDRLMTFPCVQERLQSGSIALHGWHYIIEEGVVHILDLSSEQFIPHV